MARPQCDTTPLLYNNMTIWVILEMNKLANVIWHGHVINYRDSSVNKLLVIQTHANYVLG
jgi:hypothetical protein